MLLLRKIPLHALVCLCSRACLCICAYRDVTIWKFTKRDVLMFETIRQANELISSFFSRPKHSNYHIHILHGF
jgi:hypothetical protein